MEKVLVLEGSGLYLDSQRGEGRSKVGVVVPVVSAISPELPLDLGVFIAGEGVMLVTGIVLAEDIILVTDRQG